MALAETRSKILISMKLASRELGVLSVESDREGAFGAEDRVLLEGVADSLARFLTGRGKYLARKARTDASGNVGASVPLVLRHDEGDSLIRCVQVASIVFYRPVKVKGVGQECPTHTRIEPNFAASS